MMRRLLPLVAMGASVLAVAWIVRGFTSVADATPAVRVTRASPAWVSAMQQAEPEQVPDAKVALTPPLADAMRPVASTATVPEAAPSASPNRVASVSRSAPTDGATADVRQAVTLPLGIRAEDAVVSQAGVVSVIRSQPGTALASPGGAVAYGAAATPERPATALASR